MEGKIMKEIALLKYSIIAPVVTNTYTTNSKIEHFREEAQKKYTLSNGIPFQFAPFTAKGWYLKYMKKGFDGLLPKTRADLGKPRVLNQKVMDRIVELKKQYQHITGSLVYQKLIEEGTLYKTDSSLSTILRFIRDNNLKASQLNPTERKAFAMEFSNDMWQADSSHGPILTINGKKVKTYIIAFIDDASRMIVGCGIFLSDNAINMQAVFKKAIAKYGVPTRIFVDNGSPYKNNQLEMICASVGTVLIHSRAYSPESKGKIERTFGTIKSKWMHGLDWTQFDSVESLEESLLSFINSGYNNSTHSGIDNKTPKVRFLEDQGRLKYKPMEVLENDFLHRETRKVKKDATVQILNNTFEVPQEFISQKIELRYSPSDLSKAFIFNQGKRIHEVYPLNRIENSKVKRKTSINYDLVNGGEVHV